MTQIDTTRLRSKGHLIIPAGLREGFKEGEELVVTRVKNRLTLEKASSMSEKEKEDLEFSRGTKEAWKEHDRGEYIEMDADEFLETLNKW